MKTSPSPKPSSDPIEDVTTLLIARAICAIELAVLRHALANRGPSVLRPDGSTPRREDVESLQVQMRRIEAALDGPAGASMQRLCNLFRLNACEQDLLTLCIAQALDPEIGVWCGRLNGNAQRNYATAALVSDLFGHAPAVVWNPSGAVALWGLVRVHSVGPGEFDALSIDPVVPAWLNGDLWLDRMLAGVVRNPDACEPLAIWPLEMLAGAARRALGLGKALRIEIEGPAGSGRELLAAAVASAIGRPALLVDTGEIAEADWPDAYMRLQRLAAVGGTALIWTGPNIDRPWPGVVAPAPLHFVLTEAGATLRRPPQLLYHRAEMPEMTLEARRTLWKAHLPTTRAWNKDDIERLASQYRLGAGDIVRIGAHAPESVQAAAIAARELHRMPVDHLLQVVQCPYVWDDLVLPATLRTALQDFAFEAAERDRVAENPEVARLFARENKLVMLLSGPSGVGKTMVCQVIARHLGLELLRVDSSALLSKYLGDTAKNLNRVFAIARQRQAILFFDEADAHFTRRTEVKDAHDRYANSDTSHLLQLIEESSSGGLIVVLATNRRSDIDPSFVRRLRHIIELPRPQAAERTQLWRRSLEAVTSKGNARLIARTAGLAEAVEVSGAQIKNSVLTAVFISRREGTPLRFAHLVRALDRELEKDGRSLPAKEREGWLRDG